MHVPSAADALSTGTIVTRSISERLRKVLESNGGNAETWLRGATLRGAP
jgi:hypothetical protein